MLQEVEAALERPTLRVMLDAYERQLIQSALASSDGNQRRAARALGLLATTLHEKMKRLGLIPRRLRSTPPEPDGPTPS